MIKYGPKAVDPMTYKLLYHPDVKKWDFPRIDEKARARIKKAIDERLAIRPELYGTPLQRTLKGYWKQRVGDYRAVYKFTGNTLRIVGIIHQKKVYTQIARRM